LTANYSTSCWLLAVSVALRSRKFLKTSHVVILAWVARLATACGHDDDPDFGDSYCTELMSCCAQARRPNDGTLCRQTMQLVAAGHYNDSAASACLAELKAQVAAGACTGLGS
jgi:hypothetical protein